MKMNEKATMRREWVKNVAIIFLSVMLVLTFFSNTIMNYSLPEVSTQNAASASITAKIRGTGAVVASDPYDVVINESRVIANVAVTQGVMVEKGDVLFLLEDVESMELVEAIKQLDALELAYEQAILTAGSSTELVEDVESGNVTPTRIKLSQIDSFNKKIDALQDAIDSYNKRIAEIDVELTKLGNGTVDTSSEEEAVAEAQKKLAEAQAAVDNAQAALDAANRSLEVAYSEVRVAEAEVTACQQTYDEAASTLTALAARKAFLEEKERQSSVGTTEGATEADGSESGESESGTTQSSGLTEAEKKELAILRGDENQAGSYLQAVKVESQAKAALEEARQNLADIQAYHEQNIASAQKTADDAMKKYNEVLDIKTSCEKKLADAQKKLTDKQNSDPDTSQQDELNSERADLTWKISQATGDMSEAESDLQDLLSEFSMETEWSEMLKQIREQEQLVVKLRANANDATITAPVSGMVSQVNYVAGETTSAGATMAQIVMVEKGYTLSFSVTNEQVKKISVGDVAEVQNSWYYNEIYAKVIGFKSDPSNPQNRLVVFEVSGDVQDGQSLTLSVGQRSATYDVVVPNSAIREDNNGKFVLIVESKSSPLGNRYIATRVDVEVLASDDTMSAVSGGLYGWEYVITTASKPVEAGQLVRLPD